MAIDDELVTRDVESLNRAAFHLAEALARDANRLRIDVHDDGNGVPLIDCGIKAPGSLEAGLRVAQICLGGLARVSLVPCPLPDVATMAVAVWSDQPVKACLASQYAGWQVNESGYFAMGSGPMRLLARREPLFDDIPYRESATVAVGFLETSQFPPPEVSVAIANACEVESRHLTLLTARTRSLVGTLQVVARSVETALHKLHALEFDIHRVTGGYGVAPMPPIGGSDLIAMGRTNDAVLYGSRVTLWVTGDDESIAAIVPLLPSCSSADYGRNFLELFEANGRDFYRIDPLLFSPAQVMINNVETGRCWNCGDVNTDLLQRSFGAPV